MRLTEGNVFSIGQYIGCPLCGYNRGVIISRKGRLYSGLHVGNVMAEMKTVLCMRCSLAFRSPMPTEEQVADYYMGEYYEKYKNVEKRSRVTVDELMPGKIANMNQLVERGIDFSGKRILDVGAGRGLLLEAIRRHYEPIKIFGIEPSSYAVEWCKSNLSKDLTVERCDLGSFVQSDSPGNVANGYDVVLLHGVLEHLENPGQALKEISTLLSETGVLVIRVPNEEPRWMFDVVARFCFVHLLYFTQKTLITFLNRYDYNVIKFVKLDNGKTLMAIAQYNPDLQCDETDLGRLTKIRLLGQYKILMRWMHRFIVVRRVISRALRSLMGDKIVNRIRGRRSQGAASR